MAIDQELLEKIRKKLGIGRARAYQRIQQIALTNHFSNHVASLQLAAESGISYGKYASAEDRAELRGSSGAHAPVNVAASPSRQPSAKGKAQSKPKPTRDNSIFVVHGRDKQLTDDMYSFLHAIGLNPMEWDHAIKKATGGANPIVGNIISDAMKKAQGVLVLLSPDELAQLKSVFVTKKDKKQRLHLLQGQPRPNVIFEAGLALGAHSDKTILVQVGDIREISDIAGKHLVHLTGSTASRKALAARLRDKLKFKVDLDGNLWLTVGNFDR